MSSELKRFLEAKKTNPRLIGDIERHLMAKPAEERRTDVLHPSEMAKSDWCLRASYFALTGVTVKKDKPNLRLQSIFDEGHSIHAKCRTGLERWEISTENGNAISAVEPSTPLLQ